MALFRWLSERRAISPETLFRTGADTLDWDGTLAGVNVTYDSALTYSGIWACVRLITSDIARLPVHAFRQEGDTRILLDPQPSWIEEPDPGDPSLTRNVHISQVVISVLLDGNAFIHCEPNTSDPIRLTVLNPRLVEVKSGPRYDIRDPQSGQSRGQLGPGEILHVKINPKPGSLRGMSPIKANQGSIGISLAAQKWVENWFGRGTMMPGFIEVPAGSSETVEDMALNIAKNHGGWRRSGIIGFLTGGSKYNSIGVTPKDAELTAIFNHQLEEGTRIFGIPPFMVGSQLPAGVAYASAVERAQHYIDHCLIHYIDPIEAAYKRLVPGDRRMRVAGGNTYIKFRVQALLRGDPKARADFYQAMWGFGAFNADRILALEEEAPLPDGKGQGYFVPLNYTPVLAGGSINAVGNQEGPGVSGGSSVGGPETGDERAGRLPSLPILSTASARGALRNGETHD